VYEEFPRLDKNWTPIERKVVEIQIGNNPFHTITKNQFPIQLVTSCTIHHSQGLTLDHLAFK
jgi:ATP-dependent exoDNAse (exonuclease V) alpha subunit